MQIGMLERMSESRPSQQQPKNDAQDRESLSHLYREKALRYGIVFDELVRQVAVHSMDLATLVGKVRSVQQYDGKIVSKRRSYVFQPL